MSESALCYLIEHIRSENLKNVSDWPEEKLTEQAYRDWALAEMLNLITDNPFKDCEWIIEGFMIQMISFAKISSDDFSINPFKIAADEAETILAMIQTPTE